MIIMLLFIKCIYHSNTHPVKGEITKCFCGAQIGGVGDWLSGAQKDNVKVANRYN